MINKRFNKLAAVTAGVVLGLGMMDANLVEAAILRGTFQTQDDLTLDTVTGLEWLDLTVTNGLSPSQALSKFSKHSFRWATLSEVDGLLSAFNLPVVSGASPLLANSALTWMAHLGVTAGGGSSTIRLSEGWLNDEIDDGNTRLKSVRFQLPPHGQVTERVFIQGDQGAAVEGVGVYLVRTTGETEPQKVPEGHTITGLMAVGLCIGMKKKLSKEGGVKG